MSCAATSWFDIRPTTGLSGLSLCGGTTEEHENNFMNLNAKTHRDYWPTLCYASRDEPYERATLRSDGCNACAVWFLLEY